MAGKKVKCPKCGASLRIPENEATPEPASDESGTPSFLANLSAPESANSVTQPEPAFDPFRFDQQASNTIDSETPSESDQSNETSPTDESLPTPNETPPTSVEQKQRKTWWIVGGVAVALILVVSFFLFRSGELRTEQIVARFESGVAYVEGKNGSGSGFIAAPGIVVTNSHVIGNEFVDQIQIRFPSAGEKQKGPFPCKLLYEDSARDLAVLRIETDAIPLKIASEYAFRRGQEVTVVGSPGFGKKVLENAVSRGVMSSETEINDQKFFQLSISINPGNSGGPVFDSRGQVIGVLTAKATKQEGVAFCVPLVDLRTAVKTASERPKDEIETCVSMHRLVVVYRRVAKAAHLYSVAMDQYSDSMNTAIKGGLSATDGLRIAKRDVERVVNALDSELIDDVKKAVPKIAADMKLPDALRTKFVELWTTYGELKDYVDNPRGSYNSYSAKSLELGDARKRISEAMRISLGLDE